MLGEATIERLVRIVGKDSGLDSPEELVVYSYDGTFEEHQPDVVVIPWTTEQVSEVMALAASERIQVVTIGMASGLAAASVPFSGGIALAMTRMKRLLEIDEQNAIAHVEAGIVTADLQAEVEKRGLFYPPDPSSIRHSTIGGNIACNAGGPRCLKYGVTGDYVLGLTVVLADGRVLRTGGKVIKDVVGYDMTKLFVGSHGTLGLIADVTLKLSPLPRARATVVARFDRLERGLASGAGLLRICRVASALVLCHLCDVPGVAPYVLFFTVEGLKEEVNAELDEVHAVLQAEGVAMVVTNDAISGSELWADWVRSTPSGVTLLRLGVAPKELPSWLHNHSSLSQRVPFISDLANGLVYMQATHGIQELELALQSARESGGYVVLLNAMADLHAAWRHAPGSLDLMHALKAHWDPRGLLNPGVLLEGTNEN